MPRKKSVVHRHFKKASNQGDRRIEVVECVHCGHHAAGNNVTRLLKHLQGGCWPANSLEDPALLFENRPAHPATVANANARLPATAASSLNSLSNSLTATAAAANNTAANNANPAAHATRNAALTTQQPRPLPSTTTSNNPPATSSASALDPADQSAQQPYLLVESTVKDTKDPPVSRLLAIPRTFTFRLLQRALSIAFGYRSLNGMFDISYPNWIPGRGRPPRRKQICIFHDEQQKTSWHAWDEPDQVNPASDERYLDDVSLDVLLAEVKSCKIVFHAGPWAHEVEILGASSLTSLSSPPRGLAVCLAGEGHPVLESSDPLMWQAFKDAYATASPSTVQKSYRMFYEKESPHGDFRGLAGSMPWKWDKDVVNRDLRLLPPAPTPPAILSAAETQRVVQALDEDENDEPDEALSPDEGSAINRLSNAQHVRNPAFQSDQILYDHHARGLGHTIQQGSYAMADHGAALEQLRYG